MAFGWDDALAIGGTALGIWGGNESANAAERAAAGQERAGQMSLAEMKRQFDISQNQMAPWLRGGRLALNEQLALMGLGGDTEAANRALMESPGYRFALEQGNRNLAGSTAARGGMGSGKALTGAMQWGQNYATGQRANRLSELSNLSGTGLNTASGMGAAGMNYARGAGDIWQNMANATGAAGIAGANARTSGILGGAGLGLNLYDYMNRNRTSVPVR